MPEFPEENPLEDIISDEMYREACHIETFLTEVFHITEEEHEESKVWMQGLRTGEMPESMKRIAAGPILNEDFLATCKKFEMHATPFRKEILDKLYATAIGNLS
jgi:hypothetical protein